MTSGQGAYRVDVLDEGRIHLLGRTEQGSTRFHHAAQNTARFKAYAPCISGTIHLIFPDHSLPWVIEATKSGTMDKGVPLCSLRKRTSFNKTTRNQEAIWFALLVSQMSN